METDLYVLRMRRGRVIDTRTSNDTRRYNSVGNILRKRSCVYKSRDTLRRRPARAPERTVNDRHTWSR